MDIKINPENNMLRKTPRYYGFTLVDLIITISIAAILMAIAAPSFISIIQNNRMTAQYNELLAHLSLARSEAISRDNRITVCQSSAADKDTCSGESNNWHAGWIVFVDVANFNTLDAGEETIRIHDALSGENTLNFNGGSQISYLGSGLTVADTKRVFTLCSGNDASQKGLVVSTTGRVRHAIAADNGDLASC
jgi:type IV fimbrial biogenesis protein FimT